MNLIIKQSNTPESVTSELIDRLYNLTKPDPITGQPAANAVLIGRIEAPAAYEDAVNFLNTQFSSAQDNGSDLRVSVLNNNYYIRFADPEVESVLKTALNKAEGEGITTQEAAKTVANYFQNNTDIESFDELKYFAVPSDSRYHYNFTSCTALKSIDITGKEDRVSCNGNNSIEYFYGINGPKGFLSTGHTGTNFSGCGGITTLELTCSTNMVTNAYRSMGGLQTLIWKLSPGVQVGWYSFYNSSLIERVIVDDLDSFWTHDMGGGTGSPFQNKIAKLIVNDVEVTSVTVPQTIIQIPPGNWCGARLTACTFHSNIISIGNWAFAGCNNLVIQDLNLPNLATLGSYAFQGTKVQIISDLGFITSIPESCFKDCTQLSSVSLPNSLTSIGSSAFENCTNLATINFPSTITSVGGNAFKNTAWFNNQPDGLICIGNALYKCKNMSGAVVIPNNISSITTEAFRGCSGITSVTIPDSVTSIGSSTFYGCTGLTSMIIPSNITSIGYSAFEECANLVSITVPNSVTSIGNQAFRHCYKLKALHFPNGATTVPYGCCSDDYELEDVVIPEGYTSIQQYAFVVCRSLQTITLPSTITNIGPNSFGKDTSLTEITVLATTPPSLNSSAFDNTNNLTSIYVPAGSVDTYKSTSGWSTYASIIQAIPTT